VRISVEEAIERFRQGEVLILVDDEDREDEGDFVIAAQHVTAERVSFLITHGRGLVCAPISGDRASVLKLLPMCPEVADSDGARFTVSVDARDGIRSGISAQDRARTLRLLADEFTTSDQLTRPGHIFPLIARDGGVLERPGHTEAAVDLARLAGLSPAAVLCEILNEDGSVARGTQLDAVAARHGLGLLYIADLIAYRHQGQIEQEAAAPD